ncbi:ABC transporter permease [Streptacidiphilus pinicola]|uniref:ABC transporter permease n=2 Tax=Streptacidiphilus pinicola TaxID=2219663 RepID=A0A2X0K4S4_9ACTN|nr:ABC transporter permease [Streptacidiphilus pinicola]RAG82300.1 ABC transporter permease [Streptacidiphilus pinicola]
MFPALLSEWIKVKTVRSTFITLLLTFVVTVGLGALVSALFAANFNHTSAADRATFDATSVSFSGIGLGQLALIVFSVLVVTSEYSSGMIRATLAAVPQRLTLLLAKVVTVLGLVAVISLLTAFVSFFLGQALLGSHRVSISDPGVTRAVFGMAIYMTLLALLSVGVAFMVRRPIPALAILMPFFFLISPILNAVPKVKNVAHYFPDVAGRQLFSVRASSDVPYGPLAGFFIVLAWAVACIGIGYLLFKRRDA